MADSREVLGIIDWVRRAGVPHKVTATWDDPALRIHTPTSYHYREGTAGKGLAVDLAGPVPSRHSPELRAIYNAYVPIRGLLAELLGPGDPGHDDHVHVAVRKGTFLTPGGAVTISPDDPALPNITGPVSFHPIFTDQGTCTGYYIFSTATGEVHGHGPGALYHGRSEVIVSHQA